MRAAIKNQIWSACGRNKNLDNEKHGRKKSGSNAKSRLSEIIFKLFGTH